MTGIVIFAHGSSVETANEGVRALAAEVARQMRIELIEPAFLECGQPDLAAGVARLVARGAQRIVVVPFFLTLGIHLQRDLPRIVRELSAIHNGVDIEIAPPLEGHPALVTALMDRINEGGAA